MARGGLAAAAVEMGREPVVWHYSHASGVAAEHVGCFPLSSINGVSVHVDAVKINSALQRIK